MPPKRKVPRKWGRRQPARPAKKAASKPSAAGLTRRIEELTERIDIVLPEVITRMAALEHVLVELKLCTDDDLRRAREFVRELEE